MVEVNYGLRGDGGIAAILPHHHYLDNKRQTLFRLIYDLLYFFPIKILLLNFILGIIVDTFKQLREEKDSYDFDMEHVCFICGLTRLKIKGLGLDFESHNSKDHSMWNYVYYLLNLHNLEGKDKSGYELYVDTLIKQDNYSFFPSQICREMQK